MHFAYSPHSAAINDRVFAWVGRLRKTGCPIYALLDGSMFTPRDLHALARASVNLQPALAGSDLEAYGEQGPLMALLDDGSEAAVAALLLRADGIPALSFIAGRQGPDALNKTLTWLATVDTEEGPRLHCRFADTRTTPGLLACLTPEQRAVLGEVIAEWAWIARDATLQAETFTAGDAADPLIASAPFRLDPEQFAFMLTAAETDMVFQMLVEKMPDALPDATPLAIYGRLERLLASARGYGISDLPDLFHYAVVGLSTGDDFDRHPAVDGAMQRIKREGLRFGELAGQWPEEIWQQLGDQRSESISQKSVR